MIKLDDTVIIEAPKNVYQLVSVLEPAPMSASELDLVDTGGAGQDGSLKHLLPIRAGLALEQDSHASRQLVRPLRAMPWAQHPQPGLFHHDAGHAR